MTTLACVWAPQACPQSHLHSVFQHISKKNCCLFMLHLPWAQRSRIRWRASRRVSHRETDECVLLKPQSQAISASHIKRLFPAGGRQRPFLFIYVQMSGGSGTACQSGPTTQVKAERKKSWRYNSAQCEGATHCCNNEKRGRGQPHHLWSLSHL